MKRVAFALAAVLLSVTWTANADDGADPSAGHSGFVIHGFNSNDGSASGGGTDSNSPVGGGQAPTIVTTPVCSLGGAQVCSGTQRCADGSIMLHLFLSGPDGLVDLGYACASDDLPETAAPPQVTPGMVLAAFRRIEMPESELNIQPANGRTLVNFETSS